MTGMSANQSHTRPNKKIALGSVTENKEESTRDRKRIKTLNNNYI